MKNVDDVMLTTLKQKMRAEVRPRRRIAHTAYKETAAEKVRDHFFAQIPLTKRDIIGGYWPRNSEMDIKPILTYLSQHGYKVSLPVITEPDQPLVFRSWKKNDELQEGIFGVMEPLETAKKVIPTLLLIPLLAFDRGGYRLGYGGGYYDRTIIDIKKKKKGLVTVGMAYATQEVKEVPHGPMDQPLDWFVTEKGVVKADPSWHKKK